MKLLIALMTLLIVGCGAADNFNKRCSGEARFLCDVLLGENPDDVNDRIDALEDKLDVLENRYNDTSFFIDDLESQINDIKSEINNLEDQNDLIQELSDMMSNLKDKQDFLQQFLNQTMNDITQLQGYDVPVEYIDPCGDGPGFDEIIIKTQSGKLIAYFEQGNGVGNQKRFLTELSPGSYVTTDSQECSFSVNSNGEIIDE